MSTRIPFCLLVGAMATVMGCSSKPGRKSRLADIERAPRLETITPERRSSFVVEREYTATVEPMERADIYAQVRGVVQYLSPNADIGRHVRGESVAPTAAAAALGLCGQGQILGTAVLLAGHREAEVLITLAVPDVVADRDNKRALLALAEEAREQAGKLREVAAREVKEAVAQRKRFQAEAEYRASQYERMVRLVATETVQKQNAEEAMLQHKSALAAFEAAEAQLMTKEAKLHAADGEMNLAAAKVRVARAELERVEALVGFASIRAPFDGVVTQRMTDRGTTIKDFGAPLLTVMRTDTVRVLIDVPERDMPFLRPADNLGKGGNRAILRVPALQDHPSRGEIKGEITLTASALDPVTRTMRAEIWLSNRDGYLRPQMTGTASVVLDERKNVFVIPSSAVVRQADKALVYCVTEIKGEAQRGVVRHIDVKLGVDDGRVVEIRSGLTGTEKIITKGNGVVREGDFAVAVPAR